MEREKSQISLTEDLKARLYLYFNQWCKWHWCPTYTHKLPPFIYNSEHSIFFFNAYFVSSLSICLNLQLKSNSISDCSRRHCEGRKLRAFKDRTNDMHLCIQVLHWLSSNSPLKKSSQFFSRAFISKICIIGEKRRTWNCVLYMNCETLSYIINECYFNKNIKEISVIM